MCLTRRRIIRSLALLPILLVILACTPAGRTAGARTSGERVLVITSVTVLADLIRQVGGERVDVRALVPSGADPNTFQPAPRQVLEVARADLVIFNGLGLDRTVRSTVNQANRPDLPVVFLSDGLPVLESGLTAPDPAAGPGRGNAYLWLDPRNAMVYAERIGDNLGRVDPAHEPVYRANATVFRRQLASLDGTIEDELRAIPAARRKLVTLHDAFPYFAARYGFELVGVAIKTPGRAPSAQEVADVARTIRDDDVPAVFVEPQLDARLLKLAARDAGIKIGTLYSDTLDQHVPSYEALLRYNARQLVNGLR
jgi:ABC-type Zn uptake system ZnuABC Zn-binding protein ZnuA